MNSKYSGKQVEAILDRIHDGGTEGQFVKITEIPERIVDLVGNNISDHTNDGFVSNCFGGKEGMIEFINQIIGADIIKTRIGGKYCFCVSFDISSNPILPTADFYIKLVFQIRSTVDMSIPSYAGQCIFFTFGWDSFAGCYTETQYSDELTEDLVNKLKISITPNDVVNNLSSTNPRLPLSAAQGKVLNEKIESMSGGGGSGGAYQLPLAVSTLSKSSTHQEIQEAFDNKYDDFIQAAKSGKQIIVTGNVMEMMYFNCPVTVSIINKDNDEEAIISYVNAGYNAATPTINACSLYINKQKTSGTLSVTHTANTSIR